jgi:hypothetical protein
MVITIGPRTFCPKCGQVWYASGCPNDGTDTKSFEPWSTPTGEERNRIKFRSFVDAIRLDCELRLRNFQSFNAVPVAVVVVWGVFGWPFAWLPGLLAAILTLLTLSETRILRKVESFEKSWFWTVDVDSISADDLWSETFFQGGPLGEGGPYHLLLPGWIKRLPRLPDARNIA